MREWEREGSKERGKRRRERIDRSKQDLILRFFYEKMKKNRKI
jgi:hypothetical protein